MKQKRNNAAFWLMLPMAAWTAFFVGASLAYIIILSFCKRSPEGMGVVYVFTLENYAKLANPLYARVLWESLLLALMTTLLCLAIGYPFGYCMARAQKKTRNALLLLVSVPFWTNALIRIYGWQIFLKNDGTLNSLLLAIGIIQKPLKLLNTGGAVLLGMTYSLLPLMILSVYSSVSRMDWSLMGAGRDLGGTPWHAFRTITLPLSVPGIAAGVVLTFVPSMAMFAISDLLGGGNFLITGNLVYDQLIKARDWPFAAAISVGLMLLTSVVLWGKRRVGGKTDGIELY